MTEETKNVRKVSVGLWFGIFLFPAIFAWFTLRKGYTGNARFWSFTWMVVALSIAFNHPSGGVSASAASSPPAEVKESPIEINAVTLASEFEQNEVKANMKYKGKMLKITGDIADISSGIGDAPVVGLVGKNMFMNVKINGIPEKVAANLNKGDNITIICRCKGEVLGSPILSDCI